MWSKRRLPNLFIFVLCVWEDATDRPVHDQRKKRLFIVVFIVAVSMEIVNSGPLLLVSASKGVIPPLASMRSDDLRLLFMASGHRQHEQPAAPAPAGRDFR